VALDLSGVADIDDHHVAVGALAIGRDGLRRADGLDLGVGLVDHRLDAAGNGLGHWWSSSLVPDAVRHSSCRSAEPGPLLTLSFGTAPALQRSASQELRAALRPGHETFYRTNSFIALSSPSMVIGYMRCENSRRMMVVDSE